MQQGTGNYRAADGGYTGNFHGNFPGLARNSSARRGIVVTLECLVCERLSSVLFNTLFCDRRFKSSYEQMEEETQSSSKVSSSICSTRRFVLHLLTRVVTVEHVPPCRGPQPRSGCWTR